MAVTTIAFGELLWDLFPDGEVLGGAPFNVAYRLHTLGERVAFVSALGRDGLGRRAYDEVRALGLNTELLQWNDRPTGTVPITFDEHGHHTFEIVPNVAYDRIECTQRLKAEAAAADCICFGTLVQREEMSCTTLRTLLEHAEQPLRVYDLNMRRNCYSRELIKDSFGMADVVKLNDAEAREIMALLEMRSRTIPEVCDELMSRWSVSRCVVTLGDQGAFACSSMGERVYVPGYSVTVVDTVGSGDAFTAGFVHKVLQGTSLYDAVSFGNALGALVATTKGATHGVGRNAVERLVHRGAGRNVVTSLKEYCA